MRLSACVCAVYLNIAYLKRTHAHHVTPARAAQEHVRQPAMHHAQCHIDLPIRDQKD
jgi:hypothetical protein